jgi:hypothetical protein
MNKELFPEGCSAPDLGCLLEDYLANELPEDKLAVFEEHYFGCAACLEAIRVRQSGPHALAQWRKILKTRMRYRAGIGIVVVVAGAAWYAAWSGRLPGFSTTSASKSIADLSRVAAPVYVPSTAGGGREDAPRKQFVDAMRSYVAGGIVEATGGLEASWRADPSRPETGYYLGACYLVGNRVDGAIETLNATIALGESPFLDPSKILLAKAYLRRDAIGEARKELQDVLGRGGSSRSEALNLLEGIEHIPETKY